MPTGGSFAGGAASFLSFGEQSEPTKSPLTRGTAKPIGGYLASDLKNRHLIFNGRHLPYNPDNTEKARHLRKNMTAEEIMLWNKFLRNHSFRFLRQKPIDNYIVDFYCAKLKLAIEIDGSQHYTVEGIEYDKYRSYLLSLYGITVIRFTNNDIHNNLEGVCQYIEQSIGNLNQGCSL